MTSGRSADSLYTASENTAFRLLLANLGYTTLPKVASSFSGADAAL